MAELTHVGVGSVGLAVSHILGPTKAGGGEVPGPAKGADVLVLEGGLAVGVSDSETGIVAEVVVDLADCTHVLIDRIRQAVLDALDPTSAVEKVVPGVAADAGVGRVILRTKGDDDANAEAVGHCVVRNALLTDVLVRDIDDTVRPCLGGAGAVADVEA